MYEYRVGDGVANIASSSIIADAVREGKERKIQKRRKRKHNEEDEEEELERNRDGGREYRRRRREKMKRIE